MHNFIVVSTPPEGQNGVFRTLLDFEKTKALQVLWIVFSKVTHYRGYLGKIWRNWKFHDWRRILDIYRQWLLNMLIQFYNENGVNEFVFELQPFKDKTRAV